MFNRTIKSKMLVALIPTITITMVISGFLISRKVKNTLHHSMEDTLQMLTNLASSGVSTGLEFEDEDAVKEAVAGFAKEEIFTYIRVVDNSGQSIFSYRRSDLPTIEDADASHLPKLPGESFKTKPIKSGERTLGYITLGISQENTQKAVHTVIATISLITIIALGVFIGLATTITTKLVNPIRQITKIAANIANGNLDQEISYQSKDEMGQLADSFREMIQAQRHKADIAQQIAQGNLSIDIQETSAADILGKAIAQMKMRIQELVQDINNFVTAARNGELSRRADASRYTGEFSNIVQGVNQLLDEVLDPINEAATVLYAVSERDMTARVKGNYHGDHAKISNALNAAIENLDKALENVAIGAEQVNTASNQISSGSQSLADGASQQASSLEEISGSLKEMAAITKQNTANTKEARSISEGARNITAQGMESMHQLSDVMNRIKQSADETAKIIKTIDDIAFQTNLLALNAAVEAARAGEAGKGFAVVAEEVRSLAMRSADAARTTAQLIEESVHNAEEGVLVNKKVYENLEHMNEEVRKVNEVMDEIAAASDQQAQGIDQINGAVDQLNQLTQQNAANSEESASTAQELSSQASQMLQMVAEFKLSRVQQQALPSPVIRQPSIEIQNE